MQIYVYIQQFLLKLIIGTHQAPPLPSPFPPYPRPKHVSYPVLAKMNNDPMP